MFGGVLLALACIAAVAPAATTHAASQTVGINNRSALATTHMGGAHTLASFPLAFEPNRGQTDASAKFVARSRGISLYLSDSGALLSIAEPAAALPGQDPLARSGAPWQPDYRAAASASSPGPAWLQALAVHYGFTGANPHPRIEPVEELPGRSNYLIGNDPNQWHTGIPTFRRVRYRDIYPGIDVVYYGNEGRLEFDVEVAPGADLARVRLHIDGADALSLDANGDLRVQTALGDLVQHKPVVYQFIAGERRERRGGYLLRDQGREVAFDVPSYDRSLALVLDPTLVWTSQVGGSGTDANYGIAVDANGNWYFAGYSDAAATNFPTTVGAYQTANHGGTDAFVRKVSNDGATVVYSTLLGGSGNDTAYGIGVDATGNAYVAGTTYSANFPTTNGALQATDPSGANVAGFITALNAAGSGLNYSTYLGGTTGFVIGTSAKDIAVDGAGNTYVTGETTTDNLPTSADSFQPQPASTGNTSAFVFKFDAAGNRVFGTYIVDGDSGFGGDHAAKIAIDDAGNAYIVGYTNSFFGGIYNGVAATQIGPGGGTYDMLVARLNHTGQWLDWVTHIGGTSIDKGTAIAVDGGHQVILTGWSASSDLPPTFTNNDDWGWIGRLDETGTQVLDAIWLGAAGVATFPQALVWDDDQLLVAGFAQKPGALTPTNAIAGLDCAAQCGGNSTFGGVVALLSTGPLTLQSLTRVLGATGTDTRFFGTVLDPGSATGRMAVAGGSNGTFPAANFGVIPPRSAADVDQTRAPSIDTTPGSAAAVVDTRDAALRPPALSKRIWPTHAAPGETVGIRFVLYNNNQAPITELNFTDYLPACLGFIKFAGLFDNTLFYVERNPDTELLAVGLRLGKVLYTTDPYEIVLHAIVVSGPSPCTNVTSELTSDAGTAPPASASIIVDSNPCAAVSAGTCTSMNMSNSSCWSGGTAPTNTCNAEIKPCTGGQCNINNDQPLHQKIGTLQFDGATNVTGNPLLLGRGIYLPNNVTVAIGTQIKAVSETLDFNLPSAGASLAMANGFTLSGDDAMFVGSGTTLLNGAISGTGNVNIFGGSVLINAPPTFAGAFNVFGGVLVANAALGQRTFLDGTGVLRGLGPFATIEQYGGTFYPGTGSTPATVDVGDLTVLSNLILNFSGGNSVHSVVNASGSVLQDGMKLQLNLDAIPTPNTTYSGLITSSGGLLSGCPHVIISSQANVVLTPLCTPFVTSATVYSTERVFYSSFEF